MTKKRIPKVKPQKYNDEFIIKLFFELNRALEDLGAEELKTLFSQYEIYEPKEFINLIQTYNVEFENLEVKDGERLSLYQKFISIGQGDDTLLMQIKDIACIGKAQKYDRIKKRMVYSLVINPDFNRDEKFNNKHIIYLSPIPRDLEFGKVKRKLESYGIKFL